MPRVSAKENKNKYFKRREELGWSREEASEKLVTIPADRLEKIENERSPVRPDEILVMSEVYNMPELCNYYCSKECPIGKTCIPEIKVRDLSRIVLELVANLNRSRKNQERLIEIAADGKIEAEEVEDFVKIQRDLDKISLTVDAMQMWMKQKLADGTIDKAAYEACRKKK